MAYRYKARELMHRTDYPDEYTLSLEGFLKLKERLADDDFEYCDYAEFLLEIGFCRHAKCAGKDHCVLNPIQHDYDSYGGDFRTKGQYLNWMTEKRLKNGTRI